MRQLLKVSACAFAAIGFAAVAQAQDTPASLRDLVGARAPGGETQLQARGYVFVRGQQSDDRVYGYWWNNALRQCVTVATMQGRYVSITASPAPDCGHHASGGGSGPSTLPAYPAYPNYPGQPPQPPQGYPPQPYPPQGYPPQRDTFAYVDNQRVDLGLVCYGDGRSASARSQSGYVWNDRKDRYEYGSRVALGADHADSTVMLQFWSGGGRIRLPRNLIPPVNSGGLGDRWWPLRDVNMNSERITAQYRTSGLNRPRVMVDRNTGYISIDAGQLYGFRGTCNMIGGANHRRF